MSTYLLPGFLFLSMTFRCFVSSEALNALGAYSELCYSGNILTSHILYKCIIETYSELNFIKDCHSESVQTMAT